MEKFILRRTIPETEPGQILPRVKEPEKISGQTRKTIPGQIMLGQTEPGQMIPKLAVPRQIYLDYSKGLRNLLSLAK